MLTAQPVDVMQVECGVVSQTVGSGGVWEISHVSGRKAAVAAMRAAPRRALVYALAATGLTGRLLCGAHLRHACAATGNALQGRGSALGPAARPAALVCGRVGCPHRPPRPLRRAGAADVDLSGAPGFPRRLRSTPGLTPPVGERLSRVQDGKRLFRVTEAAVWCEGPLGGPWGQPWHFPRRVMTARTRTGSHPAVPPSC